MNVSLQSSKVLIVLVATSLAWISVLSLAIVTFLGTAISMGWIVGGILLLGLVVGLSVICKEVRRATELPDYFAEVELSLPMGDSRRALRPNAVSSSRTAMTIGGMTAGRYNRILPRRVRARKSRPRTASRI